MIKRLVVALLAITVTMIGTAVRCDAQLLTQNQATSVIRGWLGNASWTPTECDESTYVCRCGTTKYVFRIRNATDVLRNDRISGNLLYWASGFTDDDNNEDPQVLEAAFNAWAPSHLPPSFLAKMTRSTPYFWCYRQANGIEHLSTSIAISVNAQGQINYANICDCVLPDYTGSIPVTPTQAMQIAATWVSTKYAGITNQLSWPQQSSNPYYGYRNNAPILYYMVYCVLDFGNGLTSEPTITVNANTGEVWDNSSSIGSATMSKPHKTTMLITLYDNKTQIGYPNSLMPLKPLQSLAKGHKISAKAGEKAFTIDGKRIALPAKVVAKAGTLYLPWQALKSLPGVKCSYDAKLNKLDITTTPAVKKAK